MTKGSVLVASGAGHLSARLNLEGFTWKGLTGLLLAEGPTGWGPWGCAVGLMKAAAHRCRMQLHAFITGVRLFLHGAQESCALQLCNEPLPLLLFLGSQFLFSSSSTSKKRIFNNWLGRACYPEAMGGSGAAPIVTSCCRPGQVLIP